MRKLAIAWFVWAALIVGATIWHDVRIPDCLALYGEKTHVEQSVAEGVLRSERFISCENDNSVSVLKAQLFGLITLCGVPIAILVIIGIGRAALGNPWSKL
jgi:hypothetical protein